jgi:hypothetical protein
LTTRANCGYLLSRQIREWQFASPGSGRLVVARKTMPFRWVFLIQMAIVIVAPVLGRLVWSSSHSMWTGYGAVFAVPAAVVVVAGVAHRVRGIHRGGETVRGALLRRRQLARARVGSPDKLHSQAPVAAGFFALASFPAVFLALVAAPSAGGLDLPPTADARLQLWCIAAVVPIAVVGVDCWFGLGISMRALATDGLTMTAVGFTIALAAASPLMIFHHVDSRRLAGRRRDAVRVAVRGADSLLGGVCATEEKAVSTRRDGSRSVGELARGAWDRRSLRPDPPVARQEEDSNH